MESRDCSTEIINNLPRHSDNLFDNSWLFLRSNSSLHNWYTTRRKPVQDSTPLAREDRALQTTIQHSI